MVLFYVRDVSVSRTLYIGEASNLAVYDIVTFREYPLVGGKCKRRRWCQGWGMVGTAVAGAAVGGARVRVGCVA